MASGLTGGRRGLSPPCRRRITSAALLSLGAWVLLQLFAPPSSVSWTPAMREAAGRMAQGIEKTAAYCREEAISMDPVLDPNGTCLVGPMYTPLFTSQGQLEAKRSSLNPDLAGLLVHLLKQAGVGAGDRVGIGASGSFPGALLATLSATEALGADALSVLSLGASSYGATRPDLHLMDLHEVWRRERIVRDPPLAVSLGGSGDVGREFEETFRASLEEQIGDGGLILLSEPDLEENVTRRMGLYGEITAFVNVGGAQANLGTDPAILQVPPGLSMDLEGIPAEGRGVLFEMAAKGIPVIHLLHIRGLVVKYGIQWDPIPLPDPGESAILSGKQGGGLLFWVLTGLFFLSIVLLFAPCLRRASAPPPPGASNAPMS